jgi:DNA-binding NtrC family response regulator
MTPASVLIVDDDPASLHFLSLALADTVSSVRCAKGGIAALLAIEQEMPSLVISDLRMPGMDGLELLRLVKERWPELPFLMITVDQDVGTVVETVRLGAVNYLVKPVSPGVLQSAAVRALASRRRSSEPPPHSTSKAIFGTSPLIVKTRHMITLAARSDVNVVVTGETGTGKELVSRAIHALSARAAGPFVAHNCAVTSAEMFDSEFFGHRKGAFTGAERDRTGLLREADGGVLFLDELECLSLSNQAKLLRVLDDGEVRPVGAERSQAVSVRFVAATNQSPKTLLERRELREDLYYRLRGFELSLPPLRERREDIPVLCDHFLGQGGATLAPAALEVLMLAPWPGNVRQLRNVLLSAASAAAGGSIESRHLDLAVPMEIERPSPEVQRGPELPADSGRVSLEELERRAIAHALAMHKGNLSQAAKALGVHRSTLRRKIQALGIDTRRGAAPPRTAGKDG